MFETNATMIDETTAIENADDLFGTDTAAGYRTPELQPAGSATKLVQGWAFSGYDCGYSTFYYSSSC